MNGPDRRLAGSRAVLAFAAAILALWLAWGWATPQPPVPASAAPDRFSAGRAMQDVAAIAMRPHPAGSTDNARVAAYLLDRLRAIGFVAEPRRYLADERTVDRIRAWSGGELGVAEITDVVGLLPGRDRTLPALLVMAHYDTVWGSPGAPDDAAGVAAALEVGRVLAGRRDRARDVVLLFTDAEETGLSGARAFFDGGGLSSRIGLVLNLESRGAGGRTQMFETGRGNAGLVRLYDRVVARPSANSLSAYAYRRMPNNTDFSVPRDRDVAGLNFAFLGRPAYYHSPRATIDRLDPATVQDMGDQVLAVAGAIATAATLPGRDADAVYFDLPGGHLVRYAKAAGWLPVAGALLMLAIARSGLRRQGLGGLSETLGGVAALVWVAALGFLALRALNLMSGAGPSANYYDRLAALPRLEVQAALALLGVIAGAASLGVWRRRRYGAVLPLALALAVWVQGGAGVGVATVAGVVAGAAVPRRGPRGPGAWWGLSAVLAIAATIAQAIAPEVAWLIGWPALLVAAAVMVAAWLPAPVALPVAAIGAVLIAAGLLPVAHLVMLGLGAPAPELLVPFAVMLFAAFWPLVRMPPNLWATTGAIALLIAAAVIAKGVRTDPIAPTVPAYSLRR